MPERRSALQGLYRPGHYGVFSDNVDGMAGITFELLSSQEIFQVAAWPETVAQVAGFLNSMAAIAGDTNVSTVNQVGILANGANIKGNKAQILKVETLKWWVVGVPVSCHAISSDLGVIIDQSHAFTCLKISGEQASVLLNRHISLDLRTPGEKGVMSGGSSSHQLGMELPRVGSWVATTLLHHVGVTLSHEINQQGFSVYTLYLPRSFSASLYELILESSMQFGVEIR